MTPNDNLSNEIVEEIILLNKIAVPLYFTGQIFEFIYTLLCFVWLIYVIRKIYFQTFLMKNRCREDIQSRNSIFMRQEALIRNYIFLIFIIFELIFCLSVIFYGLILFTRTKPRPVNIGLNCTLLPNTFLSTIYDGDETAVLKSICATAESFSFSIMIWLFGASLLHLSYAARNELRVWRICRFTAFGVAINIIATVLEFIPYTSLIGVNIHSVANQISFILVLYIAKKKFFPALKSRVNDAYHTASRREYRHQELTLKRYRALVTFLMLTFEIFILKDLVFYNGYIMMETVFTNSCWFKVAYNLPMFSIPLPIQNNLTLVGTYFTIIVRSIDIIVYFNFTIANMACIYFGFKKYLKETVFKRHCYRYRVLSRPLIN